MLLILIQMTRVMVLLANHIKVLASSEMVIFALKLPLWAQASIRLLTHPQLLTLELLILKVLIIFTVLTSR